MLIKAIQKIKQGIRTKLQIFFRSYLLILERGEKERNIYVQETHRSVASHTPPTRDLAHNPGMCPDQESNQ